MSQDGIFHQMHGFADLGTHWSVGESVTHTADRVEVARVLTILFEIFPEIEDEIVDGAGGWVDLVAPDALQDLLPGDDFVPVGEEQAEEHGFPLA